MQWLYHFRQLQKIVGSGRGERCIFKGGKGYEFGKNGKCVGYFGTIERGNRGARV